MKQVWSLNLVYLSNPDLRRMAKSPNSCGISWRRMAAVVVRPSLKLAMNEVPTARPCSRLSVLEQSVLKPHPGSSTLTS